MAAETEGRDLDRARLEAGIAHALGDASRGTYFVAERDGRVAGALLVTREWSDWRDGWFLWIQSVYTRPEARRSGIYRALYRHVVDTARAAGDVCGIRLYVERENRRAQATYEALGMRESCYRIYEVDFVLPH
jgi:ribosomal protein S18 acetylase RimI-like enzyme